MSDLSFINLFIMCHFYLLFINSLLLSILKIIVCMCMLFHLIYFPPEFLVLELVCILPLLMAYVHVFPQYFEIFSVLPKCSLGYLVLWF